MAQDDYQTIRVWKTTLANLRRIYGLTDGEKMVEILDRLVKAELEKLEAKQDYDYSMQGHIAEIQERNRYAVEAQ